MLYSRFVVAITKPRVKNCSVRKRGEYCGDEAVESVSETQLTKVIGTPRQNLPSLCIKHFNKTTN